MRVGCLVKRCNFQRDKPHVESHVREAAGEGVTTGFHGNVLLDGCEGEARESLPVFPKSVPSRVCMRTRSGSYL